MTTAAAAPVLWPFAGTDALLNVSLSACMLALLLLLPLGWIVIRRRLGLRAAGPLWPLLFFELLATFYAFMTPPWLMPDEPQHMLRTELVQNLSPAANEELAAGGYPKNPRETVESFATYDTILRSVERSQMDRWLPGAKPELAAHRVPGVTELGHPPLYYVVAAGLTAPFKRADVLGRLALLRVLGVALTGWAVWLCGAAGRMVWPTRRRMAEAPLVLAAGIPTVAAFAGAANNDVMANLVGALVLVLVVAAVTGWIKRRPWLWTSGLVATVVVALLTKRTLLPLLFALPVALALRRPTSLRRLLGLGIAVELALGVLTLGFPVQRLADWETGDQPHQYRCPGGVVGEWSMCIEPAAADGIRQYVSLAAFDDLAGRPATVGLWVRGEPGTQLHVDIGDGASVERHDVPVEADWRFQTVQFVRARATKELPLGFTGTSPGRVELDGVVLARGRLSATAPVYGDGGKQVIWDGRTLSNHLANGSAERASRRAPGWFPRPLERTANSTIDQSTRIAELWPDTRHSANVVWARAVQTFGMFWATAGWEVPPLLLPVGLLVLLAALVAAGWFGALSHVVRPGRAAGASAARRGISAFLVVFAVACAAVIGRGLPPDRSLVISGRYLFPTLVAITVVMVTGWRWLWPGDDRSFRNAVRWLALSTHAVFIVVLFFPFLAR
ncbi:MAG: hypothetical protein QOE35_769 [Actinomycetota bacterium]